MSVCASEFCLWPEHDSCGACPFVVKYTQTHTHTLDRSQTASQEGKIYATGERKRDCGEG